MTEPLRPGDPEQLGRYRMLGRLGEGGMGSVYLAEPTGGGRKVAVKVIRADLVREPEFRRRFRREVTRAQQVPPFCTAEVLDADPDHELPYLVIEYVDGPSLASVIAEHGPLSPANLHGLAIGVATALTAIHGAGIIHRDLKPGNVLLAPGSPKVIDFGIARGMDVTQSLTRPDQVVGSVSYMAPERFEDVALTQAADVFSWGAVVAYAGTGRLPFTGASMPETVAKILTQEPELTGLTGRLRELVAASLAKDPADRPTARELIDGLLAGGPPRALNIEGLIDTPQILGEADEEDPTRVRAQPAVAEKPTPAGRDSTLVGAKAPAPRRGRAATVLTAAMVVALLVLTAAVVGLLTGLVKLPGAPVANAAPSQSASASPSPSPGPAPGVPADADAVVSDPLTAAGAWKESTLGTSTCRFEHGLVVEMAKVGTYRCQGPMNAVADFGAYVDVTLEQDSCAGVWFRFDLNAGYALRVCPDAFQLVIHDQAKVTPLRTWNLDAPLVPGVAARVGVVAVGSTFSFYLNDRLVASATNTEFRTGRVVLGLFQSDGEPVPDEPRVSFANARIWEFHH